MEYYSFDPIINHSVDEDPFDENLERVRVTKETKNRHIINSIVKALGSTSKQVVVLGYGINITKAVTCVEILKNKFNKIYQITKMCQMRTIEIWEPILEGLDSIKVTRTLPLIYILISLEPLDERENGYQKHSKSTKKKNIRLRDIEDDEPINEE